MIEPLENRFKTEGCSFKTIFGTLDSHRIYAGRKVAEKIFSPPEIEESPGFRPTSTLPPTSLEPQVTGDPSIPRVISCVEFLDGRKRRLEGSESEVLSDLMDLIPAHDPELIIASYADTWIQLMVDRARRYDLEASLSCTGFFKPMASKSYWSYGQVKHKDAALIPEGRVLIERSRASFMPRAA